MRICAIKTLSIYKGECVYAYVCVSPAERQLHSTGGDRYLKFASKSRSKPRYHPRISLLRRIPPSAGGKKNPVPSQHVQCHFTVRGIGQLSIHVFVFSSSSLLSEYLYLHKLKAGTTENSCNHLHAPRGCCAYATSEVGDRKNWP